ncbi:hypothetical protein TrST_g13045 [Triparma strigata]|uniref:Uncharacterized protein n=1 Tax=Triparma strigata TaxID=1606541 RepID=A0A9W7DXZ3_9STRA|nr:hypothetical protein TrST_g13045 [Triparma strigata]
MNDSWGNHIDTHAPGLGSSSSSELSSDGGIITLEYNANERWTSTSTQKMLTGLGSSLRPRTKSSEVPLPTSHVRRTPSELAFLQETSRTQTKDSNMLNLIVGSMLGADPELARSMIRKREESNKSVKEMEREEEEDKEKVELFDMEW